MASKVAKAARGGIRSWLMPEINDIKVQLAEIKGEIKSLVESDKRLEAEIQSLKDSLNIVQRLTVLEAKQREFEKKSS